MDGWLFSVASTFRSSSSSSLLSQKYKYMTVIVTASLLSQLYIDKIKNK